MFAPCIRILLLLVVVPWGCDFKGCDFKGCDLKGCDFKGCDMKNHLKTIQKAFKNDIKNIVF